MSQSVASPRRLGTLQFGGSNNSASLHEMVRNQQLELIERETGFQSYRSSEERSFKSHRGEFPSPRYAVDKYIPQGRGSRLFSPSAADSAGVAAPLTFEQVTNFNDDEAAASVGAGRPHSVPAATVAPQEAAVHRGSAPAAQLQTATSRDESEPTSQPDIKEVLQYIEQPDDDDLISTEAKPYNADQYCNFDCLHYLAEALNNPREAYGLEALVTSVGMKMPLVGYTPPFPVLHLLCSVLHGAELAGKPAVLTLLRACDINTSRFSESSSVPHLQYLNGAAQRSLPFLQLLLSTANSTKVA